MTRIGAMTAFLGGILAAAGAWAHPGHGVVPSEVDGHTHALLGMHEWIVLAVIGAAALGWAAAAARARATTKD